MAYGEAMVPTTLYPSSIHPSGWTPLQEKAGMRVFGGHLRNQKLKKGFLHCDRGSIYPVFAPAHKQASFWTMDVYSAWLV